MSQKKGKLFKSGHGRGRVPSSGVKDHLIRYRDLIHVVGDWVWEVNEAGQYTFCSEAVTAILGYTPEEMIGKTPFDFMPAGEAEKTRNLFMGLSKNLGSFKDVENWNITRSGERICVLTNGIPIIDNRGRYRGYRGVNKDITHEKRAQLRLAKLYRCLRNLGLDYRENIRTIVETTGEILGAACVYYHRWEKGTLRTLSAWRPLEGLEIGSGGDAVVMETLKQPEKGTLYIPRLGRSRFAYGDDTLQSLGLNAYLGQPIYVKGRLLGGLCVFFREEKIPPNAMDLMGTLGEIVGREEERNLASQKLVERETFLRTLIESAIDAIAVLDLDRRFVDVNRAFCEMFGYEKHEILGRSTTLIHLSDEAAEEMGKVIYPVIRERGYWRGESRLKRRDGTIFPIESITSEFKNEAGDVSGYVAFIRDITERKRVETALEKAHGRLAQIIGAISSILIGLSADGTVSVWNGMAERTFGIREEDIVGKRLEACHLPWDRDRISQGVKSCMETRGIVRLDDVRFTNLEGKGGFLGVTINPIRDAEGNLMGALIFAADITKRKLMEAQLLQAQKMESIGQLSAGIAHEINTPTQFVGDNLNFLKDAFQDLDRLLKKYDVLLSQVKSRKLSSDILQEVDEVSEEIDLDFLRGEITKAIDQSMEGVERVANIVRAMKEFSHPGTKDREWVDLNRAIETTVTVTKNAWKYVAELETSLDQTLEPVLCLPDEMNQVILNLIVNAAQAIEEVVGENPEKKGRITVETRKGKKWVEIRVRDTGKGIPKEIQSRIFEPFFTTKEVGKGTGQGLAIAYDVVVHKHGGELRFETREGEGTTFIIRLPREGEKQMG